MWPTRAVANISCELPLPSPTAHPSCILAPCALTAVNTRRLCKLPDDGSPVTEECFQQMPLLFVGNTTLRWNGNSSTDEEIDNVFVEQGTHPAGSKWAMNPIPRNSRIFTVLSPTCRDVSPKCCFYCFREMSSEISTLV